MKNLLFSTAFLTAIASSLSAATLAPDPVIGSSLTLQIEEYGTATGTDDANNIASPVVINGTLHVVDQTGQILREDGGGFASVYSASDAPDGVTLTESDGILNLADGPGDYVYVALTSETLPDGVTAAPLPDDDAYARLGTVNRLVYRYSQNADGTLASPELMLAYQVTRIGHRGGGMIALDDGRLLLATGDALGFDKDGLSAPQEDGSLLSKLLILDADTGGVTVAAKGVRNVQQVTFTDASKTTLAFTDIGARTAEELNLIKVSDLVDTSEIENFGWGRNADGNAREGTFYIDASRMVIGMAPVPEIGFIQPHAQIGREDAGAIAITGPIVNASTFEEIATLFGDLVTGELYATTAELSGGQVDVFSVGLIDENGLSTSLLALTGGNRADPRFFKFADGSAGVLLERTGKIYRLTEVLDVEVVPLSGGLTFMSLGLGGFIVMRSRRKVRQS